MVERTSINMAALLALGMTLIAAPAPGAAQDVQRVEITGSSIKRIDGETAAPITVIKREDIERSGVSSVEQLMRNVAAAVSSNSTAAATAASATTGGISTISLRGLTAERTLILVNGRRIAPYGSPASSVAVDVDSIPVSAIDRVEVLKDGASAVYGSDAIAGVVNFILRKDYRGVELSASHGAATADRKGEVSKLSLVAGFGDLDSDRFNLLLMADYAREGSLYGRDRDFARTSIRLDRDNFSGSSRAVPGNIAIPTAGGTRVLNPRVNGATGQADCGPYGSYVPDYNPDICLFDTAPWVMLLPRQERYGLASSLRWRVDDALSLYAEASWHHKTSQTVIQPSPIDAAFGIPFTMTPDNPYYPADFVRSVTGGATPAIGVRYRPFVIGQRDLTDANDTLRLVAGLQGSARGWDYDANLLLSTSRVKETLNSGFFRIADEAGGPGIVPLLNGQRQGANGQVLWFNPFGDNTDEVSAAARATNFVGEAFKTRTSLSGLQAKLSKDSLATLGGGGLALALGIDLRREAYRLDSSPALGTGNISGFGGNFVSIDTRRQVQGVFAELIAPVTKALELDGAVRYDRYAATSNPLHAAAAQATLGGLVSDPSGDTLPASVIDRIITESQGNAPSFGKATGKLGARFKLDPRLLLRATASTGFRAPALLDLYGPLQSGVSSVQNDPMRCLGDDAGNPSFCATQFNTYTGGNSRLKPETARSLTVGLVFEPVRGSSISLDWFDTRVKNLIQTLTTSYILANEANYASRVTRGPSGEIIAIDQRLENLGEVHLGGLDADLRTRWRLEGGMLGLGWTGTYMDRWDNQNPDGSWSGNIGQTSASVNGFIPRLRQVATGTWDAPQWGATVNYNWQSGATDVCGNLVQDELGNCPPGSNPHVGAYETWDAQLRYAGLKGLTLALGVRNLMDRKPPYVNGAGGAFQAGYDPTYVDPRGRFVYLQASYTLR